MENQPKSKESKALRAPFKFEIESQCFVLEPPKLDRSLNCTETPPSSVQFKIYDLIHPLWFLCHDATAKPNDPTSLVLDSAIRLWANVHSHFDSTSWAKPIQIVSICYKINLSSLGQRWIDYWHASSTVLCKLRLKMTRQWLRHANWWQPSRARIVEDSIFRIGSVPYGLGERPFRQHGESQPSTSNYVQRYLLLSNETHNLEEEVGAQLVYFAEACKSITSDSWILKA